MLLYIHFPFCRRKCFYCSFPSYVYADKEVDLYFRLLEKEILFWSEHYGNHTLLTVYIGGGTPSLIPLDRFAGLIQILQENFTWPSSLEFTVEANPESALQDWYLHELHQMGINRLSLGVQSLDDGLLSFLGRCHTREEAVRAYTLARNAGFANINLDLIWGIPGQKLSDWNKQLKAVVDMAPEHLSCYSLTLEPGTVLNRIHQKQELPFPSDEEAAKMFVYGAEYLESKGYLQYEISNFARLGYLCQHNLGYWEGLDYLGIGPGAFSTINGFRWENPKDLLEYKTFVQEGLLGTGAEQLTKSEIVKESIMLGLRTSRGLSLKNYRQLTGREFTKQFSSLIQVLRQNELIRISQGYIRLTKNGMLVSNSIIQRFFEDLE